MQMDDASYDLFSPAPNSRRAMALCIAMVVAADGRFSEAELDHILTVALPALNQLGDERAKARRLKPQRPVRIHEFRTIYKACVAAIGVRGVPDDQFVSRVLATVTEPENRTLLFDLMVRTACSDGLDPSRELGLLRYCTEVWGLEPSRWPQLDIDQPA